MTKPLHVLVVDDDEANAFVMRLCLDECGCTYDVAHSGHAVLEMIAKNVYDVVLMDIKMPDADGMTITNIIRARERLEGTPRAKIIAVTALAYPEDRRRCLNAGMDDYMSKPFGIEELATKLGLTSD